VGAMPEPQERLVGAIATLLGVDGSDALARLQEGWS
jgi:hypothetical protein